MGTRNLRAQLPGVAAKQRCALPGSRAKLFRASANQERDYATVYTVPANSSLARCDNRRPNLLHPHTRVLRVGVLTFPRFSSGLFLKFPLLFSNVHFPISAPHPSNPPLFNALPFDSNSTNIGLDN